MPSVNGQFADKINQYWRKQGLDPEARVETTTVLTVADELMPENGPDGKVLRDENGKTVRTWVRGVRRTITIPVIVSNMIDGFPTKQWAAE